MGFELPAAGVEETSAIVRQIANDILNPGHVDIAKQRQVVVPIGCTANRVIAAAVQPLASHDGCQWIGVANEHAVGVRGEGLFACQLPAADERHVAGRHLAIGSFQMIACEFRNQRHLIMVGQSASERAFPRSTPDRRR